MTNRALTKTDKSVCYKGCKIILIPLRTQCNREKSGKRKKYKYFFLKVFWNKIHISSMRSFLKCPKTDFDIFFVSLHSDNCFEKESSNSSAFIVLYISFEKHTWVRKSIIFAKKRRKKSHFCLFWQCGEEGSLGGKYNYFLSEIFLCVTLRSLSRGIVL
jgi:hypothetical protein